jgi:type I restriction enzyme S subunit
LASAYLAFFLRSESAKYYFTSTSSQSTNLASTNSTKLKALPIPLPPLAEQIDLHHFLDCQTKRIDRLTTNTWLTIETLHEYRTALITAAVTGTIDVREAMS